MSSARVIALACLALALVVVVTSWGGAPAAATTNLPRIEASPTASSHLDHDASPALVHEQVDSRREGLPKLELEQTTASEEATPAQEEVDILHPSSHGRLIEMLGRKVTVQWDGDTRTVLYSNGQVMTRGTYINRRMIGVHELFYETGGLWSLETYNEDGRADGIVEYYDEDGKSLGSGQYVNGIKHGRWADYWRGGELLSEGDLVNGKREGNWTYYESGTGEIDKSKSGVYVNDELTRD